MWGKRVLEFAIYSIFSSCSFCHGATPVIIHFSSDLSMQPCRYWGYPLVNNITMENPHFQWVNPLFLSPFSIANCHYLLESTSISGPTHLNPCVSPNTSGSLLLTFSSDDLPSAVDTILMGISPLDTLAIQQIHIGISIYLDDLPIISYNDTGRHIRNYLHNLGRYIWNPLRIQATKFVFTSSSYKGPWFSSG